MSNDPQTLFSGALETDSLEFERIYEAFRPGERFRKQLERARARYPYAFKAFYMESFRRMRQNSIFINNVESTTPERVISDISTAFGRNLISKVGLEPHVHVEKHRHWPHSRIIVTFRLGLPLETLENIRSFIKRGETLQRTRGIVVPAKFPTNNSVFFHFSDRIGQNRIASARWIEVNNRLSFEHDHVHDLHLEHFPPLVEEEVSDHRSTTSSSSGEDRLQPTTTRMNTWNIKTNAQTGQYAHRTLKTKPRLVTEPSLGY